MWLVLQIKKPRDSLRGYCRRFLLEPAPNLFVGKANKTLAEDLVRRITESGIDAVMVWQYRQSDLGLRIKVFGSPDRSVVELDGFQVISRVIKQLR